MSQDKSVAEIVAERVKSIVATKNWSPESLAEAALQAIDDNGYLVIERDLIKPSAADFGIASRNLR